MAVDKNKGRKWDGKSRVSNDLYRKRYNEIFKKVTDDNAEKFVHGQKKEKTLHEELMEGYKKERKMREDE